MRIILNILLLLSVSLSQTPLSGDISGQHFTKDHSPFIVKEMDSVIISKGKMVIIDAGCVFRFGNYSGIIVDGKLIVNGTPDTPVVFTSFNDEQYSEVFQQQATRGDWNGIRISDRAESVKLSNFKIAYSVFGIQSNIDDVYIFKGNFQENLQFGFTIKGKPILTNNNTDSYSSGNISQNQNSSSDHASPTNGIQKVNVLDSISTKEKQSKQKRSSQNNNVQLFLKSEYGIPVLLGASGVISGVITGVIASNLAATNSAFSVERDVAIQTTLKKTAKREIAGSAVSGAICIGSLPSAVIIYLKRRGKPVTTSGITVVPFFTYSSTGAIIRADF